MPKKIVAVLLYIVLAIGTIYYLAERFAFQHICCSVKYTPLFQNREEAAFQESGYTSKTVNIDIYSEKYDGSVIHVADVTISDISHLYSLFAKESYGTNIFQTVSEMVRETDAILAINGDYYTLNSRGFLIRNGVIFRDTILSETKEILCLWKDGNATIEKEGDWDINELLYRGVIDTYSFGPTLVDHGEIVSSHLDGEMQHYKIKNPRTAFGLFEPYHYLFVTVDGRTEDSEGLTIEQLAAYMHSKGAKVAYNLDGGGSTTMVFNGEVINYPTTNGEYHEREVCDCIIIR